MTCLKAVICKDDWSDVQKNRKRTSRSRKQKQAASHSVGAERPADEDQVLGPAAGEDGMDDADGARVCLDLGCAGGGEGVVDDSEDPDVEMDSLCEGIRQLSTPAQIHFGRHREAGLCPVWVLERGGITWLQTHRAHTKRESLALVPAFLLLLRFLSPVRLRPPRCLSSYGSRRYSLALLPGLSRARKDARGASSYRSRGRGSGRGGDQRGGRGARMSGVGYGKAMGGIEMEDGDSRGGSVLP